LLDLRAVLLQKKLNSSSRRGRRFVRWARAFCGQKRLGWSCSVLWDIDGEI